MTIRILKTAVYGAEAIFTGCAVATGVLINVAARRNKGWVWANFMGVFGVFKVIVFNQGRRPGAYPNVVVISRCVIEVVVDMRTTEVNAWHSLFHTSREPVVVNSMVLSAAIFGTFV